MCVCVFASALVSFPLGDMGWSVIMSVCVFTSASVSFCSRDMGWSVIICVCVCQCFGVFSSW